LQIILIQTALKTEIPLTLYREVACLDCCFFFLANFEVLKLMVLGCVSVA